MLSKADKLSDTKCKISKRAYDSLIERNYGIENCTSEIPFDLFDELLKVDILSAPFDCSSIVNVKLKTLEELSIVEVHPTGIRYSFLTPSRVWIIDNLDKRGFTYNPAVTLLNTNNVVIEGIVVYTTYAKKITITFSEPTSGYADLS